MSRGADGADVVEKHGAVLMIDHVDLEFLHEMLVLGGAGFVVGVVLPLAFRLVGYVVDAVRLFVR